MEECARVCVPMCGAGNVPTVPSAAAPQHATSAGAGLLLSSTLRFSRPEPLLSAMISPPKPRGLGNNSCNSTPAHPRLRLRLRALICASPSPSGEFSRGASRVEVSNIPHYRRHCGSGAVICPTFGRCRMDGKKERELHMCKKYFFPRWCAPPSARRRIDCRGCVRL